MYITSHFRLNCFYPINAVGANVTLLLALVSTSHIVVTLDTVAGLDSDTVVGYLRFNNTQS